MFRPSWDDYFLEIASVVAKRATCPRLTVGCVMTLNSQIVSTGYNGSPSGTPHCTDIGCELENNHCTRAIHAEMNALTKLRIENSKIKVYTTHKPCELCLINLNRHNIKEVVYKNGY